MLGDLNIVEDSIDRIPAHPDNITATAELQKLRDKIKVIDGWRHTHPDEKCFLFQADATGSQSRIDHIYVSRAIYEDTFEWGISDTAIRTDHRLTTVRVATPNTPESGPGRWSMPAIVIKDKGFMKSAVERGRDLEKDLAQVEEGGGLENTQTLFKKFKADIRTMGRNTMKRLVPGIKRQIENLGKDRREALNRPGISEDDVKHISGVIGERIRGIELKRHEKARMTVRVRDRLEGETIGPYLTSLNAERRPREILHRLHIPRTDPLAYTTKSTQMAKIAMEPHNGMQREDEPWAPDRRNLTIDNLCDAIGEGEKLPALDAGVMGARITREEVLVSLQASASAKAPGLDGIPYEFWEALHIRFEETPEDEREVQGF